jgi:hypothetical protein
MADVGSSVYRYVCVRRSQVLNACTPIAVQRIVRQNALPDDHLQSAESTRVTNVDAQRVSTIEKV